jgi:hypothetical protein
MSKGLKRAKGCAMEKVRKRFSRKPEVVLITKLITLITRSDPPSFKIKRLRMASSGSE